MQPYFKKQVTDIFITILVNKSKIFLLDPKAKSEARLPFLSSTMFLSKCCSQFSAFFLYVLTSFHFRATVGAPDLL